MSTYEIELTITIRKDDDQDVRTLSENRLTFFGLDSGDMVSLQGVLPLKLAEVWLALQKAANSPTGGSGGA